MAEPDALPKYCKQRVRFLLLFTQAWKNRDKRKALKFVLKAVLRWRTVLLLSVPARQES